MTSDPIFLADTLAAARAKLVEAGIRADDAAVDVDVYARTILGWDKATLVANLREPAPVDLEPRFSEWITRRARPQPPAYIARTRGSWGRRFLVTPAVRLACPARELTVGQALALTIGA